MAMPLFSMLLLVLAAYFSKYLSTILKVQSVLVAIMLGLLFGQLSEVFLSISMSADFFSTLVLIILVILVLDSTAKLRLKSADTTAMHSLSFLTLFASISFVCFAGLASYLLNLSTLSSVVLATAILGVSAEFVSNAKVSAHISSLMQLEEYWSSPVALIVPLLIAIFAPRVPFIFVSDIVNILFFSAFKLLVSVACGVFVGVLLTKILAHSNNKVVPPAVLASAFIAFGLAYYFGGYGIFAVASFGFFFANVFASLHQPFIDIHKNLAAYAGLLSAVLFSSISQIPLVWNFFALSFFVFLVYLVIRYVAVHLSHRKHAFSVKEEFLLTFNAPNSAASCAVLLFLGVFPPTTIPASELQIVLSFGLMFVIYSNVLACVLQKFPKFLAD